MVVDDTTHIIDDEICIPLKEGDLWEQGACLRSLMQGAIIALVKFVEEEVGTGN